MGICYLQHRIVTGTFNNRTTIRSSHKAAPASPKSDTEIVRWVLYTLTIAFYVFTIGSILILAPKISTNNDLQTNYNFVLNDEKFANHPFRDLANIWTILLISMLMKKNFPVICYMAKNFGIIRSQKLALSVKIRLCLSYWLTFINFMLIIVTFPAIKNPGPSSEDVTILYANVRGFVPFSALGKKILPLDTNKLMNFQYMCLKTNLALLLLMKLG